MKQLKREPANIRKQDSYEINAIMAKLEGWKRYDGNKSGKLSFKDYGSQVAYTLIAWQKDINRKVGVFF